MRRPGFEPGSVATFFFGVLMKLFLKVSWKATVLPLDYQRVFDKIGKRVFIEKL